MRPTLGTQRFSYATLAEIKTWAGLLISEQELEREIAPGDFIREKAPLLTELVRTMSRLAAAFNIPDTRIRLVYGFD